MKKSCSNSWCFDTCYISEHVIETSFKSCSSEKIIFLCISEFFRVNILHFSPIKVILALRLPPVIVPCFCHYLDLCYTIIFCKYIYVVSSPNFIPISIFCRCIIYILWFSIFIFWPWRNFCYFSYLWIFFLDYSQTIWSKPKYFICIFLEKWEQSSGCWALPMCFNIKHISFCCKVFFMCLDYELNGLE